MYDEGNDKGARKLGAASLDCRLTTFCISIEFKKNNANIKLQTTISTNMKLVRNNLCKIKCKNSGLYGDIS